MKQALAIGAVATALILCSAAIQDPKKSPLKLYDSSVRKQFDALPTEAKKTVNRLNDLIKKQEYTSNEDALQKAIESYKNLFDDDLLHDFMHGYITHHNKAVMDVVNNGAFGKQNKKAIAACYFALKIESSRKRYIGLLAKMNNEDGVDFSLLDAAAMIEQELLGAKASKPFFVFDLSVKREQVLKREVHKLVKSKQGENALDLASPGVKRAFDLQSENDQIELLEVNQVIVSRDYDINDAFVFRFVNRYASLLNRTLLVEWLVGYADKSKRQKAFFDDSLANLGLNQLKREVIIISYYEIAGEIERGNYIALLKKVYKGGVADFSTLTPDEKLWVKSTSHRFP